MKKTKKSVRAKTKKTAKKASQRTAPGMNDLAALVNKGLESNQKLTNKVASLETQSLKQRDEIVALRGARDVATANLGKTHDALVLTRDQLAKARESLFFPNPPGGPSYTHPGEFTDARGKILRLTDAGVGSVQLITSVKGSVRASHYHKEDSHLCTVVSGKIAYYERAVGNGRSEPGALRSYVFGPGQSFFTGPMVEHEMHFPEDTTFIVMANRHRTPEGYEADVVRLTSPLITVEVAPPSTQLSMLTDPVSATPTA